MPCHAQELPVLTSPTLTGSVHRAGAIADPVPAAGAITADAGASSGVRKTHSACTLVELYKKLKTCSAKNDRLYFFFFP